MKKIFSILFIGVVVVSLMMIPAALVGANPGPGIAGSWHLDEGSGTTAYDSTTNNNDGALNNFTGTYWVSGKFGSALSFDGSDDYVQIANESNFDFDKNDEFTIEAYVQTDSNGILNIVTKMANSALNTGYQLIKHDSVGYDSGGENKLYFFLINTYNTDMIVVYGSTDIADGLWHHVAVTYDGSATAGGVQIYVDGTPETMYTRGSWNTLSGSILNDLPLQISGREGANYAFDGLIDEVRIWDQALSAEDIPVLASGTCLSPPSGMVSWWPGDGDASDIADGNDGTLHGATFAAGLVDQAFSFDGVDDYVEVPDADNLDITNELTIDAWFYNTGTISMRWQRIIHKNYRQNYEIWIENSGRLLQFRIGDGTVTNIATLSSGTEIQFDTWYHVAAVYDGSSMKLYLNGDLSSSMNTSITALGITTDPVIIGNVGTDIPAFNHNRPFNGLIDEVEIFNRALSQSEIQAIYNAGSAGKCKVVEPEEVIEVDIDIKPGSDPNSINLKSNGVVPVAVLTTGDFDASDVDPTTVEFAGASPVRWTLEDVDGDTDIDMLFHFKTQELDLTTDSTEATLTGKTLDEVDIIGTDTVNIVPKGKGIK